MSNVKKINLGLQGGGAHGAFAWGALDKILEDGRIEFDGVSATSAGAMNAGVLAYGYATGGREGARKALESFWRRISEAGKKFSVTEITPLDHLYTKMGIIDTPSFSAFETVSGALSPYQFNPTNFNPLHDVLAETIDFNVLKKQDKIKLRICATNVNTGKVRVFKNEEMCIEALLASGCLPFLFQTVSIGDENFWDGGYMGNPALFPLIYDTNTSDILIVHINPIHREEVPKTAGGIRNRVNEISFNSSLMREMRSIAFITDLIDKGWIKEEHKDKLKRVYIHSVRADDVMHDLGVASKLNSDWDFLLKLKELGREKAAKWLKDNFDKIGKQTTIDIKEDYL
jgi:NTE family protein